MTNGGEQHLGRANKQAILEAKGYLVDWDGCCAIENSIVPSAEKFLRFNHARTAIVSNNSSNTIAEFQYVLQKSGIFMRSEQIILAGIESIKRAVELESKRTLVLGSLSMRAAARAHGLTLENEDVDLVILMRDTRFNYQRLERAVNAILNGARLIISNPDLTHPGVDGRVKPETGALLAALGACIDLSSVELEIIGKPSQIIFDKGCKSIDLESSEVVMFGDNPVTDIAGAKAFGMHSILASPTPSIFFQNILDTLKIF
ncbi:HAD-IIA family hydrolase [Hirschia baltica]|uniref:Haloacid dehalogenase domain protein hydrolase n=1 Tax=Hirschia baltica (strain ATCC 49814 / DSM 5838 / IFAM 1418) TaxID=582402 RepID=C6XNZ0_HIRBI|nr:HAD-IA family hydrolase [Hirschia baltica]ACT60170.1 Haloacid dehalogenase domain protein hydrolase [Hirschia baltica ATCC 49814]